jgi:hypothetical protein
VQLDGPSLLLSFVIGSIGFVAFTYGRRMSRAPQTIVGVVLMAYPYFVSNLWVMGAIAVALLAAMWGVIRLGW